ncbi:MAG: TIGR03545 family protein [Gallionellaceae bacterium]
MKPMQKSVDNSSPPKPAGKKQGVIRFEAIIPLLLVLALIIAYFALFFDTHLRRGIEYAATQANGAEVNIGRLKTSLWKASVTLSDIAMTNPDVPARNRVQIGSIHFAMLWDALLRGKVVINEASVNTVQIDTPRKKPGRVVPAKASGESGEEGIAGKVLGQMQAEFSGNVIGDLAAIAGGADAGKQASAIGDDIRSSAYLDDMQKSLDEKNREWQARMTAMPQAGDFASLQQRLGKVKLDNFQDLAQLQSSLKELEQIRNEFDTKSKAVSETGTALNTETGSFRASFSGLDKIVRDDVSSLQARMHLPSLDSRTLSRALFGMDILGKLQQTRGYMEQARRYMPPAKERSSEKKQEVAVLKRDKGHDYVFGQPSSYPPFWLRKALISSKLGESAGDLSGEILDLSTNQAMTGRPMTATLRGNFPQQGISGVRASLVIDHRATVPRESMEMEVARYTMAGRTLASSPAVELGFSKADSAAKFSAELRGDNVDVRMNSQFTHVAFETNAKSAVVREMIASSVAGINTVNLNAQVAGTWSSLDWHISSNLADALSKGMQRYLGEKMDAARARIEAQVYEKIDAKRKQLYARQGDIEANLKSGLGERQAQIEKIRAELDAARSKLEARKNALLGEQQQKLRQGTDKALENLRKLF